MSEPTWVWLSSVISTAFVPISVFAAQSANPSFDCSAPRFSVEGAEV
jgi:hypothetical protein